MEMESLDDALCRDSCTPFGGFWTCSPLSPIRTSPPPEIRASATRIHASVHAYLRDQREDAPSYA